ncbi:MAG: hypothetical protein KY445_12350 [Armatimonadetes bacterium]|nr:hypothetical protein [Armatimonadota bacterium]
MTMKLAFIGTGQISSWHLSGLAKLNQHRGAGVTPFELVALADPRVEAAQGLAAQAEKTLGRRPTI